jgi:type II secretory ATPase GspE/PulE/Tfp pilus assembly ATPase PilB-like protein
MDSSANQNQAAASNQGSANLGIDPRDPAVLTGPEAISPMAKPQSGPGASAARPIADRDSDERLAATQAAKSGIPYFDTRELEQVVSVEPLISLEELKQYLVAPLHHYSEQSIELGLTDQTDRTKLPELQQKVGKAQLTFKTISPAGFNYILNHLYYMQFEADRGGSFEHFGQRLAAAQPKEAFKLIAQLAFWLGASDVHIEPQSENARIRFRLDGILHPITTVEIKAYEIFLSDLQTQAEITWGSDKPQSGRISFELMDNQAVPTQVNMRIETIPTFHGEEIVVRIFNAETRDLTLATMGFSAAQVATIEKITAHPNGMMLTVGPTGSGKTSTLYAIINRLNNPEVKIVTLEDPVEYDLPGISQIQVRTEDKELFAEKLRAVMREDPNVVMIGEIRDVDTAKTALQAALTGHLVLSTFHAGSAAAAISRMLDMIGRNPLFASAIRMIIAQRLARRVCPHCVAERQATPEEQAFIKEALTELPSERRPKLPENLQLKYGKGCNECHGIGYKGRVAIIEMMPITPDIEKSMINVEKTTSNDIQDLAVKNGMATLLEDGLNKALAGQTTISEIMRISEV